MSKSTVAGIKLHIADPGAAPAFPHADWTEVGGIVEHGEFGRVFNMINSIPVAAPGTSKFKGSYDDGTLPLVIEMDPDDDGQVELKAALDSPLDWNFIIELNDKTFADETNNSTIGFKAKVASLTYNIGGGPDNMVRNGCSLAIAPDTIAFTKAASA